MWKPKKISVNTKLIINAGKNIGTTIGKGVGNIINKIKGTKAS